ncbi:MAG: adenine deaminase C-terminal domain-containing protein, partial [Chloroflexota bacterium]
RLGSAWQDVKEGVRAITEMKLDSRRFILCTDDSHSETLVCEGHVDRAVRAAIANGVSPMAALQMTTINTAEHFGLSRDLGMIAPGRYADLLLVDDLTQMHQPVVYARGKKVAENGVLTIDLPSYPYPDWAIHSVHLGKTLSAADFRLAAPHDGEFTANVIGVIENQAPTRHLRLPVTARDGAVPADRERDLAKLALVERHKGSGRVQVGLVHGFQLSRACAIASTVAHDSHHMVVIGTDEALMAQAANTLAEMGGGQVVVQDGQVIGRVSLPIAGLMSNAPADQVAAQAETVLDGFRACGCPLNNPNMQLSLLALVVIPELRISDLGLVDVTRFELIAALE